jgi:hypothetical protein
MKHRVFWQEFNNLIFSRYYEIGISPPIISDGQFNNRELALNKKETRLNSYTYRKKEDHETKMIKMALERGLCEE